jgi:hypothetical protein
MENVVMRGRLSTDYKNYVYTPPEVYKYYDRNVQIIAQADSSSMTNYCILLEAYNSRQDYDLGCCGP